MVEDGLVAGEPERDYDVFGADFAYQHGGNLDLRGEWIRQNVDSDSRSSVLPGELELEAWYLQAAYRLLPSKWEVVGRYGEFDINDDSREQWAAGVNLADRWLAQLAYGF